MRSRLLSVALLLALGIAASAQAAASGESLSGPTQDILKMAKAGVDESLLIAFAEASRTPFGLSTSGAAKLVAEGLPPSVLAAMQQRDRELKGPLASGGAVTEDQLFRLRFGLIRYGGKMYQISNHLDPEIAKTLEADPAVQKSLSAFARLHATSGATLWSSLALLLGASVYGIVAVNNDLGSMDVNRGIMAGAMGASLVSLIVSGLTGDAAYMELHNGLAQYNRDLIARGSGG